MSNTPEALRLAELLGTNFWEGKQGREVWDLAAAELRRLAGEVQRLQFEQQNSHEAWEALSSHAQTLRAEAERYARNRDMWKAQCERQAAELEKLRRGEFICGKCGLRQPGESAGPVPF